MAAGGAAYVTCTTCFRDRATARDASNPLPYPFELPGFQERTREKLLRTKVALDFDKAKLHVLIDAISKACDVEIRLPPHLDEDVLSRTLSLKVKDLSGYNALALVLGQYGLAFEIESQGYIRVMRHSGDYLSNGVIRERQRLEEIRRGEHEDDREKEKKEQFAKKAIGQVKVTLDFENQQLKDVFEFIRTFCGMSIVFESSSTGRDKLITYKAQNVPLDQALKAILEPEYGFVLDPKLYICDREKARALEEAKRASRARRDRVLSFPASTRGASLTFCLDRLRRIESLPIVTDRDVWEQGKALVIDAVGEPLKDFLDRASSRLGAKWLYCEETIYLYMPSE